MQAVKKHFDEQEKITSYQSQVSLETEAAHKNTTQKLEQFKQKIQAVQSGKSIKRYQNVLGNVKGHLHEVAKVRLSSFNIYVVDQ